MEDQDSNLRHSRLLLQMLPELVDVPSLREAGSSGQASQELLSTHRSSSTRVSDSLPTEYFRHQFSCFKMESRQGPLSHPFSPSTQEAEVGGFP